MARRTLTGRKLLVASIGVASVTYAACSNSVGNLMPSASEDASVTDAALQDELIVGNLMALPPPDGGDAACTIFEECPTYPDAGMDAPLDGAGDATLDAPADAPEGG